MEHHLSLTKQESPKDDGSSSDLYDDGGLSKGHPEAEEQAVLQEEGAVEGGHPAPRRPVVDVDVDEDVHEAKDDAEQRFLQPAVTKVRSLHPDPHRGCKPVHSWGKKETRQGG